MSGEPLVPAPESPRSQRWLLSPPTRSPPACQRHYQPKAEYFFKLEMSFVDQKVANGNASNKGGLLQVKQTKISTAQCKLINISRQIKHYLRLWQKKGKIFIEPFPPACQPPLIIQATMSKAQLVHPYILSVASQN